MIHLNLPVPNSPLNLFQLIAAHINAPEDEIKKYIRLGMAWYQKRRLKDPLEILKEGEVEVFYPNKPINEYTLNPNLIQYEDEHIILVYKEPGVPSCPTPFSDMNCLTWGVQKYLQNQCMGYEVQAVHRLDQPAQGLIFFAKHKTAEKALHLMFYHRLIKKFYLAVTPGINKPLSYWFIKDTLDWRGKFQKARSFIKHIADIEDKSYFIASPLTGRPHQLRKHFANYFTPIIGDAQYGPYTEYDELQLISFYYQFKHPMTEKEMKIFYLPGKYTEILKGLCKEIE